MLVANGSALTWQAHLYISMCYVRSMKIINGRQKLMHHIRSEMFWVSTGMQLYA